MSCDIVFSDNNECLDPYICGNGTCNNVVGGFECLCSAGFTPGSDNICEGKLYLHYLCRDI